MQQMTRRTFITVLGGAVGAFSLLLGAPPTQAIVGQEQSKLPPALDAQIRDLDFQERITNQIQAQMQYELRDGGVHLDWDAATMHPKRKDWFVIPATFVDKDADSLKCVLSVPVKRGKILGDRIVSSAVIEYFNA